MTAELSPPTFEAFCQQLLQLLDEGRFVATYKFAVLIGLLDVLAENVAPDGTPSSRISTRDLAAKVTELYWPHSRPFTAYNEKDEEVQTRVLPQNSGAPAVILKRIAAFREQTVGDATLPLSRARAKAPDQYRDLLRTVEHRLILMPLGKLQFVGDEYVPFIYTLGWDRDHPPGLGAVKKNSFDGHVELLPGVADHLLRASALIRPLVQRTWALTVSRLSDLLDTRLEHFLFGEDRVDLTPITDGLRDVHGERCFYCGKRAQSWQVDHFVPWARRIDNGLANLVLACSTCNASKRDFLASAAHVERWVDRLADVTMAGRLAALADEASWPHAPEQSVAAARSIYLLLPVSYRLWMQAKYPLVEISPGPIASALARDLVHI